MEKLQDKILLLQAKLEYQRNQNELVQKKLLLKDKTIENLQKKMKLMQMYVDARSGLSRSQQQFYSKCLDVYTTQNMVGSKS